MNGTSSSDVFCLERTCHGSAKESDFDLVSAYLMRYFTDIWNVKPKNVKGLSFLLDRPETFKVNPPSESSQVGSFNLDKSRASWRPELNSTVAV